MADLYNLTNFSDNINSTVDIVQGVNDLTNGWFGIFMGIALFAIVFIYISFYNLPAAFTAASVISALLNSYLYYVGLFPLMGLIMNIGMVFIGMMIMVMFGNE